MALSQISPQRLLAARLYPRYLNFVDKLNRTPLFVDFVRKNESAPCYAERLEMYDDVMRHIGFGPIDYLEFGVWRGASIKYWVEKNADSASRFVGFDTFTGLPEAWDFRPAGTFDVKGAKPKIEDQRVSFVVGLFQQTLSGFLDSFGAALGRRCLFGDALCACARSSFNQAGHYYYIRRVRRRSARIQGVSRLRQFAHENL